ncbi:MAG TPA: hypothetical protein VJZ32_04655 [Candidatus Bathyarchaeia archaeon]|nr:hypothetical protein [Candidatus Bathyarchaeia archaeon]
MKELQATSSKLFIPGYSIILTPICSVDMDGEPGRKLFKFSLNKSN